MMEFIERTFSCCLCNDEILAESYLGSRTYEAVSLVIYGFSAARTHGVYWSAKLKRFLICRGLSAL